MVQNCHPGYTIGHWPLTDVSSACRLTGEVTILTMVLVCGALSTFSEYNLLPQPANLCELSFSILNPFQPFLLQTSG